MAKYSEPVDKLAPGLDAQIDPGVPRFFAAGCKLRDVRQIMKEVENCNKTLGWVVS